jgi:hypothetical protein
MKLIPLVLALLIPSATLFAQWVPVSGRVITTTETIASDGTVNTKWKTTSLYARSSSGSVLTQRLGRSGKPATATLLDYGKSQRMYSLTYRTGQVNDLHRPLDRQYAAQPPTGMTDAHRKVSLGNDKVNGIDCFIVPVYDLGPNRTRVQIGKAWLAPAYNNLILREDVTRTRPDGSKRHIVREMKLTSQSEPDASLFSTDRKVVTGLWKPAPAQQ